MKSFLITMGGQHDGSETSLGKIRDLAKTFVAAADHAGVKINVVMLNGQSVDGVTPEHEVPEE